MDIICQFININSTQNTKMNNIFSKITIETQVLTAFIVKFQVKYSV